MDVTAPTAVFVNYTYGHDADLVIVSGFGNEYGLLKRPEYLDVIVMSAHARAKLYSSVVRCTRSCHSVQGFLVTIGNMMTLEILFGGANQTYNQTLYNIEWQHANRTMYEHFHKDNSTYHVVEYNETDDSVIQKYTAQDNIEIIVAYFANYIFL